MDPWVQCVIEPIGFKQCKKSQWNSWWTNNSQNLRKNKIRKDNVHGIVQFHWLIKNLNMKVFIPFLSTSKVEQNLLNFTFMHINVSIIFNFANLPCHFYFPKELPMFSHCWHLLCCISTPCSWFVLNPCFFNYVHFSVIDCSIYFLVIVQLFI
jgi:hypothetical protein